MSGQNVAILPTLAEYQEQLANIEAVMGSPWQPLEGCTDGSSHALVIPSGRDNLVDAQYPRTKDFSNYKLTLPTI